MKRIITIVLAFVIVLSMTLMLSSCDKTKVELENSWDVPDYTTEGTVVSSMSAIALFLEALDNYYAADNVVFVRSMDFVAGVVGTQQTIEITKFNNDKVFHQSTKQGTGAGKTNEGTRFYFNGTNAYKVVEDSSTRFPSLGTEDWSGME